ncbi:MAG: putative metalloprotease CJM1_0395 family protein [Thermodesulforhabdaceae bacterium]
MGLLLINSISFTPDRWRSLQIKPSYYSDKKAQNGKDEEKVRPSQDTMSPGKSQNTREGSGSERLTEEERRQLEKLKEREREVVAHEQAHISAGGRYVRGGPTYQYERGPDGNLYIVGGEVSIDSSPIPDDPSATIEKMLTVIRAALAPSQPSGQDYQVAAKAQMELSKAQMELLKRRGKEAYSDTFESKGGYHQSSEATSISLTV